MTHILSLMSVAALKVWVVWGLTTIVLAGLLLTTDPTIDLLDAVLIGSVGMWVLAWFLANLCGPIGLFQWPLLWALLGIAIIALYLHPPTIYLRPLRTGEKLVFLSWGLLSVGLLPLSLSSPVPPYMDVFGHFASVQRILAFHHYNPFDDPYGLWGYYIQTPALELFYATLATMAHISLAAVTISAMMVPMAGLLIFSTYRLGLALFDDASGGAMTLLLFMTCLFRRMQGMRGTVLAFIPITLGLAFFIELPRNRFLAAIGALLLGTSIPSHAANGIFGLLMAATIAILWLANPAGELHTCIHGLIYLLGASLIGLPELFIGLHLIVPYPVIPTIQLTGLSTLAVAWWLSPPQYWDTQLLQPISGG